MEFGILGPLEVVANGRSLALGGLKQRALLTMLLLEPNRVVSTDGLVDALWGERPTSTARTALHGLVSELRKALGSERDRLVTRAPGYVLRVEPNEIDAIRFERLAEAGRAAFADGDAAMAASNLREALALWRGAPLADFAFDDFAQAETARLEEARLAAVEDRIEADLALGRHAQVVGELERLIADDPLRERLRGQLMVALYRSGRQADALAAYSEARRTLSHELGLDPSPQLQGLERAVLRQDPGLELVPAPDEPESADRPPGVIDELKPVTALFADIVGSTALGERLSPEEVKALVGECVTAMSRAVEEYGGTVQAYMGDGICAYFGVPSAHEDDPERAARAALRIHEVVGEYAADIAAAWGVSGFDVRIGINSGQTVVGAVGAANPQTVALGDPTNVAARLQAAAAPGTIVVGAPAARRLAGRFQLEPIGELQVKGRAEPVAASRLVRPSRPSRAPLAPLVGREGEVARLQTAVDELRAGRGQVVLVSGEPGIGKTRLLAELRLLGGEGITWLEGHCLSYGGLSSWPFIEILRGWLGVEDGDAEIAVRTKARARIGAVVGDRLASVLPPLAQLLRIRLEPELEQRTRGPAEDPALVREAYATWLEALAAARPVVLALEDLHWADVPTRELIEELLQVTERAPVLLACTLVGDRGSEGWRLRLRVLDEYAHRALELPLGPLRDEAGADLLRTLLPGALDDAARAELVARAEGNPLYLEELLRALVEGGGVVERRRTWTLTARAAELMPPALENLLVARIDRLAHGARRLVQAAAMVGREFPVAVLRRMSPDDVEHELTALLRAGVVREVRRYPEFECAFKHGLLQEAALSTLTAPRRRELAAAAAAAWEAHFATTLDDHLERLAHYHAQAEDHAKALEYVDRAARRAFVLDADRASTLRRRADALAAELGSGDRAP